MSKTDIAVVTGGASGIGAGCCAALARQGRFVVVLDRDLPRAEQVAREIGGQAVYGDVGDEAGLTAVAAWIEENIGPVVTLVNSAGVLQRPVSPAELSMEDWDRVVHIDQRGTYLASKIFAVAMMARRNGNIVNIASTTGSRSVPLHAYAPAKAAVISMTACLAAEWGPSNIRVNCVSPGYTRTPALQAAIDKGERDVSVILKNTAMGRMVETDEVGKVVAFLASSEASAVTGINLTIDCGWTAASTWGTYGGLRQPE